MAYSKRLTHKRAPLSAEFMYLLVVLAAALITAWWAAHRIGMDLSGIETVVSVLGIDDAVGTPHQVGYSEAHADDANASAAPYCQPGQQPAFANGMAQLKQQVGSAMGVPLECEHAATVVGDTVQQTSTGLAAYNGLTNTETFTDGWHHWALSADGLVTWDGTDASPTTATDSAPSDAATGSAPEDSAPE
jgi:hypothetical protein